MRGNDYLWLSYCVWYVVSGDGHEKPSKLLNIKDWLEKWPVNMVKIRDRSISYLTCVSPWLDQYGLVHSGVPWYAGTYHDIVGHVGSGFGNLIWAGPPYNSVLATPQNGWAKPLPTWFVYWTTWFGLVCVLVGDWTDKYLPSWTKPVGLANHVLESDCLGTNHSEKLWHCHECLDKELKIIY